MQRSRGAVDLGGMLARHVHPGRTYLLTRRCSDRRFFLRPSAEIHALFAYALARAVSMTREKVHACVVMSNHIHLVVTDTYGERPRMMGLLNAELGKSASALIGRLLSRLVRAARLWPGATSFRLRFGDEVVAQRPTSGDYENSCQPASYSFRLEVPPGMDGVDCH